MEQGIATAEQPTKVEQGLNTTTNLNHKDPVAKQAKWDKRKQEIVQEVHEKMKSLGTPHCNDSKGRKKNIKEGGLVVTQYVGRGIRIRF